MANRTSPVQGMDDLLRNLRSLHGELAGKAIISAVAGGAALVAQEARKNAKAQGLELSGDLIKNIAFKRDKRVPNGKVTYRISVRNGRRAKGTKKVTIYKGTRKKVKYTNDPFYWWFHEFGTSKMPARPFLRPAFEANQEKIKQAMARRLRMAIERFKRKYG